MPIEIAQDGWYAVAASTSLSSGEIVPARLFGEERVVWRDDTGKSHVWDNRCIHRGMRLQYGFVDGGRLACRYHGWRFGPDAKCALIPAHPEMTPPDDFCIPAFASAETGGLIWTSLAASQPAPERDDLDGLQFCRTIAVAADAAEVCGILPQISYAGFATPRGTVFDHSAGANGVCLLRSASTDMREIVALALQPVGPGKCQIHLLAAGGEGDIPGLRRHVSAWARRLRWFIENGAPEAMSWTAGENET